MCGHNFVAKCVLLQHTAVSHCSGTLFSKIARTWCFINLFADPAAVKNRLSCADFSHSLGITWSRLVCNYKHVPSKRNHQDPHCWHSEICGQGKCKKGHGSLPWHAVPHLLPYKLTQIQYASIRINTKSTNFSQTFTKCVSFSASKQLSLYWTHPWALLRHFQGRVNYNTLGQFQRGAPINPKRCWKYLSCHFWRYTTFTTYPKFSCIKKVVHVSRLQKCDEIDHPVVRCTATPSTNLPRNSSSPPSERSFRMCGSPWLKLQAVNRAVDGIQQGEEPLFGPWVCQRKNASHMGFLKPQAYTHKSHREKNQLRWYSQQQVHTLFSWSLFTNP